MDYFSHLVFMDEVVSRKAQKASPVDAGAVCGRYSEIMIALLQPSV